MRFLGLRRVRASVVCLVLLLSAAPALAQPKEEEPFYDVYTKKHVKPMVPWAIGVGFMVACLLVGIKNPRRSHLD